MMAIPNPIREWHDEAWVIGIFSHVVDANKLDGRADHLRSRPRLSKLVAGLPPFGLCLVFYGSLARREV